MKDAILGYLKNRVEERSSKLGLAVAAVMVAKVFFPEYGFIIDQVALALGVTTAATPDKKKPK